MTPSLLLLTLFASKAFGYATLPPMEVVREECKETSAKVEEREGTIGFLIMPGAYCTATLISPHVVLTAGHCVTNKRPETIRFSLASDMGQKQEVFYAGAQRVLIHPDYQSPESERKVQADLALIQLDSTNYSGTPHSYYSLGGAEHVAPGAGAVIIGYGTDKHGLKGIKRPKHVKFESLLMSQRDQIFKKQQSLIKVAEGDTGEGPCKGDSGAPLLKYVGNRMAIIGIYSEARARVNESALSSTKPGVRSRDSYVCRATESSYAISLDPYAKWVSEGRAALETDRGYQPCP